MADLKTQLCNYRLTTAKILYHMPDHVHLLQEYIWQDYDLAPKFPKAATADPKAFVDPSLIKELESSGFIKQLYKK